MGVDLPQYFHCEGASPASPLDFATPAHTGMPWYAHLCALSQSVRAYMCSATRVTTKRGMYVAVCMCVTKRNYESARFKAGQE